MPKADPLLHSDQPIEYFLVGDDAFTLKTGLMKPLSFNSMTHQYRVYNCKLSRARRVVKNAFGILASRFRCLLVTLPVTPQRVFKVTHACCVLHNFLRHKNSMFDVASLD